MISGQVQDPAAIVLGPVISLPDFQALASRLGKACQCCLDVGIASTRAQKSENFLDRVQKEFELVTLRRLPTDPFGTSLLIASRRAAGDTVL